MSGVFGLQHRYPTRVKKKLTTWVGEVQGRTGRIVVFCRLGFTVLTLYTRLGKLLALRCKAL